MKTLLFYALLSALLLWGCRDKNQVTVPKHVRELPNLTILPENPVSERSISLSREMVFTDSLLLDEIVSVAVDDSGNVFFAGKSWERRVVHVFEPDGIYRRSIGNYGEGDGEFLEISGIQIRGGRLFVFDDERQQANVFLAENGEFFEAINLRPNRTNPTEQQGELTWRPVWAWKDGTYLVQSNEEKNPAYYPDRFLRYFTISGDGKILSGKILEQKDTRYLVGDYAGRPAPFTLDIPERSLLAISNNDELYSAWTGEFLIKMYDMDGNYLRAYYHPFDRTDLNPVEVIHPRYSHNLQLRRIRESTKYPEKWPALYSVLVDDKDRIWVSTVIDDDDHLEWWIIVSDTVYAKFKWPKEKPVKLIKDGFVYAVETNSAGFKEVVRYRIDGEQESRLVRENSIPSVQ